MNWNGSRETLNHLIARRIEPQRADALQAEFNQKRRAKIQSALNTRPVFLPLEFKMTAAGQVSPYRDTTQNLGYDVLITGVKADIQTRDIVVRRTEDEKPIVYTGDELNLFLRADDIAGQTVSTGGGQLGTFYLPTPILLPANNRLSVEMYKTDTTGTAEEQNIVFIGVRVFDRRFGEILIDAPEQAKIDMLIQARECPRVVFLKQLVEFDSAIAGGEARNLFTPQVDEPLLIRGMRTTLRQSLIEVSITDEPKWTVEPTPIWAVAGEDELVHDNYQWFSRPIYLHSKRSINVERVINSIDGSLIDAQTGNQITWICETV